MSDIYTVEGINLTNGKERSKTFDNMKDYHSSIELLKLLAHREGYTIVNEVEVVVGTHRGHWITTITLVDKEVTCT